MNNVQELIAACEEKLHTYDERLLVGNRPHYPMCVMFNDAFSDKSVSAIYKRVKRFWPSSVGHELFFRYHAEDEVSYDWFDKEQFAFVPAAKEELEEAVRLTAMQRDVHAELTRWYLLNVIDTKDIQAEDEFKRQYNLLPEFKERLSNQCKSLLVIVLRDEKSQGEDTAYYIRKYLEEQYEGEDLLKYDATVIISDLTRENARLNEKELLSYLTNIFIIADNDAVTEADDEDYAARALALSGEKLYTVSCRHLERPNENISKQICDILIGAAKEDSTRNVSSDALAAALGITNGKMIFAEKMLESFTSNSPTEFMLSLPLNKDVLDQESDFNNMSFSGIKRYLADADVVDDIAETQSVGNAAQVVTDTVCEHIKKTVKAMPLSYWTKDDAEYVNGSPINTILDTGKLNEQLSIQDYYAEALCKKTRKKIYAILPMLLKEVKEQASSTKVALENVQESFEEIRPVQGYQELGRHYKNITEDFIKAQGAIEDSGSMIHGIATPGNEKEHILNGIKECFDKIIETNKDNIFSKSFNEEWEMRLNQTADMIYREIQNQLVGKELDDICLYGGYTASVALRVFMLHTSDELGDNETGLYKYLKNTFNSDEKVQYMNTGFDDELDAVSLISIDPRDLVLGCS